MLRCHDKGRRRCSSGKHKAAIAILYFRSQCGRSGGVNGISKRCSECSTGRGARWSTGAGGTTGTASTQPSTKRFSFVGGCVEPVPPVPRGGPRRRSFALLLVFSSAAADRWWSTRWESEPPTRCPAAEQLEWRTTAGVHRHHRLRVGFKKRDPSMAPLAVLSAVRMEKESFSPAGLLCRGPDHPARDPSVVPAKQIPCRVKRRSVQGGAMR